MNPPAKPIEQAFPLDAARLPLLHVTWPMQLRLRGAGSRSREDLVRAWQACIDGTPKLRTAVVTKRVPRPLCVVHRTRQATVIEGGAQLERFDLGRPDLVRLAIDRDDVLLTWHPVALDESDARGALHTLFGDEASRAELVTPRMFEGGTLVQRFDEAARRFAERVAVTCDGASVTYAELHARAETLARALCAHGVGPEVRVALQMERGIDMVVAILGVLKAGGAYVPIDPRYPRERQELIARDAGAKLVLTSLDVVGDAAPESLDPDNAAYVIYTSGSTGTPKGCVVTHANVTALMDATRELFTFDEHDVWTLFHSFAFDFSVWELWGALLYGGRVVIVPYETSRAPEEFAALLARERVTVLNQTPSAFRALIPVAPEGLPLRYVIFGGEALDPRMLQPWIARYGDAAPQLINMYGITETTVHVTFRRITASDSGSVIGGAIPSLELHVENSELLIGGYGVARGYLDRPDLTAERFIPDPFSGRAGARLYRSGDVARFREDGELIYEGRADQQVKIRGFRIETGEIEAALSAHSAVNDAVVIARDGQLVAYVVEHEPVDDDALRETLARTLPDYMLPAAFVRIARIPVTAHGKLDRAALPAPSLEGSAELDAPSTPAEIALAEVWSEVLGVQRVGAADHYFRLGGDSLRALEVVAKTRRRGVGITVQQIFLHPVLRELAAVAVATSEEQLEIEPFSLVSAADRARLPHDAIDAYPVTQMQLGMLYHDERDAANAVYRDTTSYTVRAHLDVDAMQRAMRALLARHDALRTSFHLSGFEKPLQVVHRDAALPCEAHDLRGKTVDRDAVIDAWLEGEKRRAYDATRAPLLRFAIHRWTDDEWQIGLSFHHVLLDGWSEAVLFTDLFALYRAELEGSTPPSPPRSRFASYVAAEQHALRGEETRTFWRETLAEVERVPLPRWTLDAPAPSARFEERVVDLDAQLYADLQALAARAGVPLKSVVLAAHLKVLSRLQGRDDVVTGVVANGRGEEEGSDRTLGLFLNTLPFRARIEPGSWLDLVRRTFERERQFLPHRHYPVAAVQRLAGTNDPLFDTGFNFIHFHVLKEVVRSADIEILGHRSYAQTSFPLLTTFAVATDGASLRLSLQYDASIITSAHAAEIEQMVLHALRQLASAADASHTLRPLLDRERLAEIVEGWNDTARDYDRDATIHQLIERKAHQMPDAIAVTDGTASLTYRDLNERANRLAQHLFATYGTGKWIAIHMARTIEMVPALLAVLKSGNAYAPIEISWPDERVRTIIDTLRVSVVLCDGERAAMHDVATIDVTTRRFDDLSSESCGALVAANDLAYVIFTSGSTGTPKGVMVRHQPVINLIEWAEREFRFGARDRVLFITSLSFDLSVFDIFGILATGGSIRLASNEEVRDPERLVSILRNEPITFWDSAPAALQQLAPLFGEPRDSALRLVFLSGDWIPLALPDPVRSAFPGAEIIALGGATEATVWSNFHRIGVVDPRWSSIPYGRPMQNARYHVLDTRLVPLPTGVAGDLYIGGECLSTGYLGDPALTAAKYVPDPFASTPGARLYRTGDRARYWPDGTIEFLGRVDQQVKIRGHRIELGEIEAALQLHPAIRSCVVLAHGERNERMLAAYVISEGADVSMLRTHLRERLPDAMIPAAFVFVDAFPVTANGKLDRKALPSPDGARAGAEYVPPRDPVESELCAMWSELLGLERVGIHDNFFDIGGHSLLATRLITRVRERYMLDVPLRTLFESPTVAALAAALIDAELAQAGADNIDELIRERS